MKLLLLSTIIFFGVSSSATQAYGQESSSQTVSGKTLLQPVESEQAEKNGRWYAQEVTRLARNNPTAALEVANQAKKHFLEKLDPASESIVLNESSYALYFLARYPESMQLAKSAEILSKKYYIEKSLARSYVLQGNILQFIGEYEGAIKEYNKALTFYRNQGDLDLYGRVLNNIANVYYYAKQYEAALKFYNQYREVATKDYDRANVALGIANSLGEQGKVDEAIENYQVSIELFAKSNDQTGWELALTGMGQQLLEKKQPEKALELFEQALASATNVNRQFTKMTMLEGKAKAFFMMSKHDVAKRVIEESLSLAKKFKDKSSLVSILDTQLSIYESLGNLKDALRVSKEAELIKSQYVNEQTEIRLAIMQTILEVEKKDHRIRLLSSENKVQQLEIEQQRVTNIAIIGSLLFLSTALFFIYYRRTQARLLTEQTNINRQLEELNELKNQLLANTSHELRTPLNGIIGMTQLLLDDSFDSLTEESHEQVRIIDQCGKRLLALIEDILDLTQLQAKQLSLNIRAFELKPVIVEVFDLLEHLATNKGLKLVYQIEPEDVQVLADQRRLLQVLNNLVGNAIKFSLKGCITISAYQLDGKVRISVKDQGEGISKEGLEMIFEPFAQVDGSSIRSNEGSGLGLPITKALLLLHESEIEVSSVLGEGSEFSFSLPLAEKGKL